MAYVKGVNVNVLAESGQTDEETIAMYERKHPEITLALKGKEELNIALFGIEHNENFLAIKQDYIEKGLSEKESDKLARSEADFMNKNALANYEKLKKKRRTA